MTPILPRSEAITLIRADHDVLIGSVEHLTEEQARRSFRIHDGPLGHFCDTLHDLVAHVVMWSEISLAVLHEARAGRKHWSIDPRWETPEIGSALNRTGVMCGREFPTGLMIERLVGARDGLSEEIKAVPAESWDGSVAHLGATLKTR